MKKKTKIILGVALLIIVSIVIMIIMQKSNNTLEKVQTGKASAINSKTMSINEAAAIASTSVNPSQWDESKVKKVTSADGEMVPVPKGYTESSVTTENRVESGFVIYEGENPVNDGNVADARAERNQWVWVPVPIVDRIYEEVDGKKISKLYAFTNSGSALRRNDNYEPAIVPKRDTESNLQTYLDGISADELYQELQAQFDETIESIKTYGGFYIGRYETGNLSQAKPVVQKYNTDIASQTWWEMYKKCKLIASQENVQTSMIFGNLYDETLQWLHDMTANNFMNFSKLVTDSREWGNYNNVTLQYKTSKDSSEETKEVNTSRIIPTGGSEATMKNNIYDMAGNVWERTLEVASAICRVYRGGSYRNISSDFPATCRVSSFLGSNDDSDGCRAYLYIK